MQAAWEEMLGKLVMLTLCTLRQQPLLNWQLYSLNLLTREMESPLPQHWVQVLSMLNLSHAQRVQVRQGEGGWGEGRGW